MFHPIYYASKSLNGEHRNYIVTEQELSALYAFEKNLEIIVGHKSNSSYKLCCTEISHVLQGGQKNINIMGATASRM